MCGIAGWIDFELDLTKEELVVVEMTKRLVPRGPDAAGFWFNHQAGLGHRRLVVVDPEGGKQPMVREYHGRTFVLIYNGELYNTNELRSELIVAGHQFRSYSDTEVVLVSYLEWGKACVEHFNGIYAFGVWDDAKGELFLARDRMGVKPLFYTEVGRGLVFASELKALLVHPRVSHVVDCEGVGELIGLGPAHTPGQTIFKNIHELRPGWRMDYNQSGLKMQPYWSLSSATHQDSLAETVEKVGWLVEDAIKRQLVSDVPVCTLLSGGLDSSIITAVAATKYQAKGEVLHTFSVDYRENEKYFTAGTFQPDADEKWIEIVSKYLKTEHHRVLLDIPELIDALDEAVLARDLPGMADVDSSLYLFCKIIKTHATVALSGECADEVFWGYPWFYRPECLAAETFPWSQSLLLRQELLAPRLQKKLNLAKYVTERYHETLAEVPRLEGEDPTENRQRELFYLNLTWFMQVLLERKDRMSMAHGLEVRVPFCDHRLVEYVWNIPWHMKYLHEREKGLLRQAVTGFLPEKVIYRKKSPYPKTHHPLYFQAVKHKLLKVLAQPNTALTELIDPEIVKSLLNLEKKLEFPWFGQLMTLPQLAAYLLQIDTWLQQYQVKLEL